MLALDKAMRTSRQRTIGDLERLGRVRQLLTDKGEAAGGARLLLFSASGFDRNGAQAASERADVELIDLERMYRGS